MASGGNSFNDFPDIVPTREIITEIDKTFFYSVAVGLFLECSKRSSISSTYLNPALVVQ